jgi:hypothetical protein
VSNPSDKPPLPDWASGYAKLNRALDAPPTRAEVFEWMSPIIDALTDALGRIRELEKGSTKYVGTYQRAVSYKRGSLATHDGALWAALRDIPEGEKPGTTDGWQLAVKSSKPVRP